MPDVGSTIEEAHDSAATITLLVVSSSALLTLDGLLSLSSVGQMAARRTCCSRRRSRRHARSARAAPRTFHYGARELAWLTRHGKVVGGLSYGGLLNRILGLSPSTRNSPRDEPRQQRVPQGSRACATRGSLPALARREELGCDGHGRTGLRHPSRRHCADQRSGQRYRRLDRGVGSPTRARHALKRADVSELPPLAGEAVSEVRRPCSAFGVAETAKLGRSPAHLAVVRGSRRTLSAPFSRAARDPRNERVPS
jgi:hypothetical protein